MNVLALLSVAGSIGLLVLMVVAAVRALRERPAPGVGAKRNIEGYPNNVIELTPRRASGARRK